MKIEIQVLGVGGGASKVLNNEPSTSWVLLMNDIPKVLFDIGLGVTYEYVNLYSSLPNRIYISHNHSDHSGELPVLLAIQKSKGAVVDIISNRTVMTKIISYRLHELKSTGFEIGSFFNKISVSDSKYLELEEDLSIKTIKSNHSEECFGVILSYKKKPLIGWSADSGFNEELYNNIFMADYVILDARTNGNAEHADFKEIDEYMLNKELTNKNVIILGYGKNFTKSENYHIGVPQQKYLVYDDLADN